MILKYIFFIFLNHNFLKIQFQAIYILQFSLNSHFSVYESKFQMYEECHLKTTFISNPSINLFQSKPLNLSTYAFNVDLQTHLDYLCFQSSFNSFHLFYFLQSSSSIFFLSSFSFPSSTFCFFLILLYNL
jgi:hypothetical protein